MPLPELNDTTGDTGDCAPHRRMQAATRSIRVSIAVNLLLTVGQVSAGMFAKSQGLIADGIHSLSDLIADAIVLIANRHSQKAADENHPYGHHRYETAASMILGGLLLAVGVGMLWSAFKKLEHPASIPTVHILALWFAGGALIAKELLFRYMLAVAKRVKSSMLVASAWHARSDAASSLVVGLGVVGNIAGFPLLDPIAALIVGLMVSRMGWNFAWEAFHDLMDRSADENEVRAIRETILDTPGVYGVHDLRTRKMGDMIIVDADIEVDALQTVEQGHEIAVDVRKRVMQRHRVLNLMAHIDPAHRPVPNHSGIG